MSDINLIKNHLTIDGYISILRKKVDILDSKILELKNKSELLDKLYNSLGDFYVDSYSRVYLEKLKISECSRMDIIESSDGCKAFLRFSKIFRELEVKNNRLYKYLGDYSVPIYNVKVKNYDLDLRMYLRSIEIYDFYNLFDKDGEFKNKLKWIGRIEKFIVNFILNTKSKIIENGKKETETIKKYLMMA